MGDGVVVERLLSKNINNTEYKYVYFNGLLLFESRGQAKFYYSYDSNGILYSVKYTLTDNSDLLTYYYTHNSRGDIVGIYNGAGELRAHYEYDAWGNVLSVTDQNNNAITSATHIGNLNPFRYRGYYLDSETGFYYLLSRYYDPVTHRFINSDGYFQSGSIILDANTFAYCANNPVNYSDPTGEHYCGDPTCFICRPDYRKFINDHIEWHNRITGQNVSSIGYDGTIYYNESMVYDFDTTEYRVIGTIASVFASFEASADAGFGLGYQRNIFSAVDLELVTKGTWMVKLSLNDGFDFGQYIGEQFGIDAFKVGYQWEVSSFESYITHETEYTAGPSDIIIGLQGQKFFMVGYSYSVGFNASFFVRKMNELWGMQ